MYLQSEPGSQRCSAHGELSGCSAFSDARLATNHEYFTTHNVAVSSENQVAVRMKIDQFRRRKKLDRFSREDRSAGNSVSANAKISADSTPSFPQRTSSAPMMIQRRNSYFSRRMSM